MTGWICQDPKIEYTSVAMDRAFKPEYEVSMTKSARCDKTCRSTNRKRSLENASPCQWRRQVALSYRPFSCENARSLQRTFQKINKVEFAKKS